MNIIQVCGIFDILEDTKFLEYLTYIQIDFAIKINELYTKLCYILIIIQLGSIYVPLEKYFTHF